MIGILLVAIAVFMFTNKLVIHNLVSNLDVSYALLDEYIPSERIVPTEQIKTRSRSSFIAWQMLGSEGQKFILNGPTKNNLTTLVNRNNIKQPLRVYAGLRSAESIEKRAQLVLDEMIRVDAFSRRKLVIATPTGTGWIDPEVADTFEYLHAGDTAIVTMQYAYLPS